MNDRARVHPTAIVADSARIGDGTQVWAFSQVREHAAVGEQCVVGQHVTLEPGVLVGRRVKIQNNASVFSGVTLEDGVFVGPHACFTNDLLPRAINPDGSARVATEWEIRETRVKMGAAIGANATVLCGVTIGIWAMIGAGSVVTKDVPDHALVSGNPARVRGYVCACAKPLRFTEARAACVCGRVFSNARGPVREVAASDKG